MGVFSVTQALNAALKYILPAYQLTSTQNRANTVKHRQKRHPCALFLARLGLRHFQKISGTCCNVHSLSDIYYHYDINQEVPPYFLARLGQKRENKRHWVPLLAVLHCTGIKEPLNFIRDIFIFLRE